MSVAPADRTLQRPVGIPVVAAVDPLAPVLTAVQSVQADSGGTGRRRVAEALSDDVRRDARVPAQEFFWSVRSWSFQS